MHRADLHIHTDASDDATQTPEWVFSRATELGLAAVTFSDHEGMVQWHVGRQLAKEHGISFLPGIEISSTWNGMMAHVLGFFPNGAGNSLESFLIERVWAERRRVQTAMVTELQAKGFALTLDEYEAEAAANRPGTFHMPLLRLLKRRKILATEQEYMVLRKAAVTEFRYPTVPEVIDVVHDAGGAVVLAHPGGTDPGFHQFTDNEIAALAVVGLDGVEVFHRKHTEEQIRYYAKAGDRLGLGKFGGSDSHRPDAVPGRRLGDHYCDWDEVLKVLDRVWPVAMTSST